MTKCQLKFSTSQYKLFPRSFTESKKVIFFNALVLYEVLGLDDMIIYHINNNPDLYLPTVYCIYTVV